MSLPLVTIITPAYNIEDYIADAIESVIAQTEENWEYFVVDDGSTDRTAEIARSYAEKDPRVHVLLGEHKAASAARNLGLQQAKGEFVAFLDGDDRWTPTFLQRSIEVLRDAPENVGATFCAFSYIDQHGRHWGKVQTAEQGDYDADRNLAGHCPQGNGSSLLILKSCFDEAGGFDEDLYNCTDLDMWLKINTLSSTPLFRYIAEPLVDWRVRPGAISASEAKRVDGLDVMFQRYGHTLKPTSIAKAYTWPAVLAFYSGKDEMAKRWTAEVRKADPKFFIRSQHGVTLGVFTLVGPKAGRAIRSGARSALRNFRKARMSVNQRIGR